MVVDALKHVGAARSIVIDEDNIILAGNGVTAAAAKAGITKLRVIDAGGDELIAVRRTGLTAEQKRALAIYDNRTAELATWNMDQLAADHAAGLDFKSFFSDEETADLLSLMKGGTVGKTGEDDIPSARPTDVLPGHLFELGPHRIVCGDSTDPAVVGFLLAGAAPPLMVTDPPYGVDYDPTWRVKAGVSNGSNKMGKVSNDDRADWTEVWRLFPGGVAYVWHAGLKADIVKASLEMAGFEMRSQIIWAKDRLVLSRGDYHWQHEPCWYSVREGATGKRTPDRSQATLWRIPVPGEPPASTVWDINSRDDGGHGHGTQKPVECMARPMRNHRAAEVFEPFSGSGSTIIAAETTGRRCYAIELEPRYVQIAIDRWEAFTGKKAVKAGEVASS